MNEDVHLLHYWAVVRRRWPIIAAATAVTLVGAAIAVLRQPKVYRAQTRIRVEMEQPEIMFNPALAANYAPYDRQRFYQTQNQIIQSTPVLKKVVADLGLEATWAGGKAGGEEGALGRLRSNLQVVPVEASAILTVTYDDTDPGLAARIADAVVQQFIRQRKQVRGKFLDEVFESMRHQIDANRRRLDESEEALRAFKKEKGLTFIQDRPLDEERMAELNQAYIEAKTRRLTKEVQLNQLRNLSPEERISALVVVLIDNRHFQDLRALLDKNEVELATLEQKFQDRHPEIVEVKARIAKVREQLDVLSQGMLNGLAVEHEKALKEEEVLAEALGETRLEDQLKEESKADYLRLKRQIEVDQEVLLTTRKRMEEAAVGESIPKMIIEVVEPASVPRLPIKPKKSLSLALGLALGAVSGTAVAFFLDYLNQRLASIEDVEKYLGLPVLALIPRHPPLAGGPADRSPGMEAFRLLRAAVHCARRSGAPLRTILVTSAAAGEGKSSTAVNLGVCMARMGDRALIVDADCRRPSVHRLLGVPADPGLSDLLEGRRALAEAARKAPAVEGLSVIPCGSDCGKGVTLLNSPALGNALEAIRESSDTVVFDSPQILGVSDTVFLAAAVDGVILVIEHNRHPRSVILQAKKQLADAGARTVGVVFNKVSPREIRHYAHYYRLTDGAERPEAEEPA